MPDHDVSPSHNRLDSWKEIAAYLGKGVRTVQRWETSEGLPIHRLGQDRTGSVFAYRSELDAWWQAQRARNLVPELAEPEASGQAAEPDPGDPLSEVPPVETLVAPAETTTEPGVETPVETSAAVSGGLANTPADTIPKVRVDGSTQAAGVPPNWRRILIATALFLAFAVAYLVRSQPTRGQEYQVPGQRAIPFTSELGFEIQPSFSPDSTKVAFVAIPPGTPGFIYVKKIGSDSAARVTSSSQGERTPEWSPDGRMIAFTRRPRSGRRDVILMPVEGGHEVRIAELPSVQRLLWSPDGHWLVAQVWNENHSQLIALSVTTGAQHTLLEATDFGFRGFGLSSDQSRLVFSIASPGPAVVKELKLDRGLKPSGTPRTLISRLWMKEMALTADGKEIIYTDGFEEGGAALLRRTLDENATSQLLYTTTDRVSMPAISADRRHLLFATGRAHRLETWRLRLDPVNKYKPTATAADPILTSTHADQNPDYSPDGKRVAFHSTRTGASEIWVADSSGGNPRRLTYTNARTTATPRWSPDGNWIAFESNQEGQTEIYLIRSNGGPARRLTYHPATDGVPSWSRDGRSIYFASDRSGQFEVYRIPVAGGEPSVVTRGGGFAAVESIDGQSLYYSRSRNSGPLLRQPLPSGQPVMVAPRMFGLFFAVGPEGVYYQSGEGIAHWNAETGATRNLLSPQKPLGIGLAISPDGKDLLFAQVEAHETDLYRLDLQGPTQALR